MANQRMNASPGCSGGGKEAEELFLLGIKYSEGLDGMPRDIQKAIKCYEEAMELGSAKAAINLGSLYRTAFASKRETREERLNYMNLLYHKSIEMGCPDGYFFLAHSLPKVGVLKRT